MIRIKKCVKDLFIVAPIITIDGSVIGTKLHFKSTSETIRIENVIRCEELILNANQKPARLSTEAIVDCQILQVFASEFFVDGKLLSTSNENHLRLKISTGKLHIGIHGIIGAKSKECITQTVTGHITGQIANFGTITARKSIELHVNGNIASLAYNTDDSAQRGFEATKQTKRINLINNDSAINPTSTTLKDAIISQNIGNVVRLLEINVDPDDNIIDESTQEVTTPRQILKKAHLQALQEAEKSGNPEQIAIIRALFDTKDWRRGRIRAPYINITVEGDLLDCGQICAIILTVNVHGNVICEMDSIWTSGSVEILAQKDMKILGQAKLLSAIFNVAGNIITENSGKVSIDQRAIIQANNFFCAGEWFVEGAIDLRLNESCVFFLRSFLFSNSLLLSTKLDCILESDWILENMKVFVSKLFLAKATSSINLKDSGSLVCKTFCNEGQIIVDGNMQLITEIITQAKNAMIKVLKKFELMVLMESDRHWYGFVTVGTLVIIPRMRLRCNGNICANFAEVQLTSGFEAQFILDGEMSVKEGPLSIIGESRQPDDMENQHQFPGFILSGGVLNAQAIIAPKVAIELVSDSKTTLNGIISNEIPELVLRTILYCGWLYVHSKSIINAISNDDDIPQRFICEETWIHEGTLKQTSTAVNFYANYFVNCGIFTFFEFENSLLEAIFHFKKRFINKSTMSAVILRILGCGTLKNSGRISATNSMAIKINDFTNEFGFINGQRISIEYLTRTTATLSGKVDATISLLINVTQPAEFEVLCTNDNSECFLLPQERFLVKSSELLKIASPIAYNELSGKANTMIYSNGKIFIDSIISFPNFNLNIVDSVSTNSDNDMMRMHDLSTTKSLILSQKGELSTAFLKIQGKSQRFEFTIDGSTKIDTVQITETIETVLIQGCGTNQTLQQIYFFGKSLELGSLAKLENILIDCKSMTVLKNGLIVLGSVNEEITKISAIENILVQGEIQVTKGLVFSSKKDPKPSVKIEGTIRGITNDCKIFHIDSAVLYVSGAIRNFEKCEINAKTTLDILESGIFHSIQELSADGEWVTCKGNINQCKRTSLTAWGLLNSGDISNEIDDIEIYSALVLANTGRISGNLAAFAAPFLFNVSLNNNNGGAALGMDATKGVLDIKSLVCLCSASQMLSENIQNTSVLLFKFETLTAAETPSSDQLKQWKNTLDMLNNNFSSESMSYEEVCRSMKIASAFDSQTEIQLRDIVTLYTEIKRIVSQMSVDGISTFSVPHLVEVLMKANNHFTNVSGIKERLLKVPTLANELYNKGVRKLKSFHENFEFNGINATDSTKKGIQESGMWSYHSGILTSGSGYTAMFVESWYNDGAVSSSAGDIEIGSKTIKQSSAGRLLSAYGSVFLEGESVDVSNISAVKEVWIEVS